VTLLSVAAISLFRCKKVYNHCKTNGVLKKVGFDLLRGEFVWAIADS